VLLPTDRPYKQLWRKYPCMKIFQTGAE
jgi:hypothetical protein